MWVNKLSPLAHGPSRGIKALSVSPVEYRFAEGGPFCNGKRQGSLSNSGVRFITLAEPTRADHGSYRGSLAKRGRKHLPSRFAKCLV